MICELRAPAAKGRLGMCIGAGPTEADAGQAVREARSAIELGYQVQVFLFGNGIYHALPSDTVKSNFFSFQQLMQDGAQVTVCSNMARAQGVTPEAARTGVKFGSLLEFSELIAGCEKVLVFGGQNGGQA
jgi:sulfur relay (sulfurtransferase) complex TusBCD TusD component (DsrE family)